MPIIQYLYPLLLASRVFRFMGLQSISKNQIPPLDKISLSEISVSGIFHGEMFFKLAARLLWGCDVPRFRSLLDASSGSVLSEPNSIIR